MLLYIRKIDRYVEEEYNRKYEEWEFLADLKKKFNKGDNNIMKVMELKKMEQESKIIKEFVQEFRRTVKESEYKIKLLVEKFKK